MRAFAEEFAQDSGLPRADVDRWLAAARFQPKIVELMDRPLLEPPKWFAYSPSFLSQARVDAGVQFWRANARTLARAEEAYGVPPEIIVAIIGVETFYGRYTGSHRVIDALATLAFDYPRRATFFRGELKEYLLLARDQGFSPLEPKGSYAGAMGLPQFMPGSYRRFAVDFDSDGQADLWSDPVDVIGSVANYLARHDWQRGQPVLAPAMVASDAQSTALRRLDGGISERRPLAAWQVDGVDLREPSLVAGRGAGGPALAGGRSRRQREPVDRLSQLLRDHALQQEPSLRVCGVGAGRAVARAVQRGSVAPEALRGVAATARRGSTSESLLRRSNPAIVAPCPPRPATATTFPCARTRAFWAAFWATSFATTWARMSTPASKPCGRPRCASVAPTRQAPPPSATSSPRC